MKLIDFLLRIYPSEFRARFGRQMRQFHDERVRENAAWPRIVGDHVASAAAEHVRAARPDVTYAIRGMLRRPGFAMVVILTIALGVGANAAIFSVVNGILFRPLPYRDVNSVATVSHEAPQRFVSEPQYATYRDKVRSFASLAAFSSVEANLETTEEPERVSVSRVTLNFFSTLGVQPILGRTFVEGEDGTRPAGVVVLSHDIWQRHFNGDSAVLGRRVTLDAVPRTVIGVMPPRFDYPSKATKLWLPACSLRTCASLTRLQPDTLDGFASHYLHLVARLRAGYAIDQARQETGALARQIMRDHPGNFDPRHPLLPRIIGLREELVGATRPYLYALLGAVGLVLLVVCANVANLLLARAETRRREMSLRAALGASKRRLVTQLLTEAVLLGVIGGALGIGLAIAGTRGIIALAPATLPRLDEIRVDWLVVAFGAGLSVIAGIAFGIVPALRAAREDPAEALKSAGKGSQHGGGSTRTRRLLVVSEVALAMILLSGAGMLVRSLVHLHRQDMGFNPGGVLTLEVAVTGRHYDPGRTAALFAGLAERVRNIRGVQSAGAARWLPVVDAGGSWEVRIERNTPNPGNMVPAVPQEVTPGYFAAMGLTLLRGRDFTAHDREGAPLVAVVSESFVKTHLSGEDALGRRFRLGARDSAWMTVIGVVRDIRARGFTDTPEPTMYLPHAQTATSSYYVPRSMTLVLRAARGVDPLTLARAARSAVRAEDPSAAVSSTMTLEAVVGTSTANRRFSTALIGGFAVLSLVLAAIGIYGVISYAVSERTFEIGVRMALGADRGKVLGLVVGDGMKLALAGIAVGVAGSLALARFIDSLLVGAPTFDLVTLGGVSGLLTLVAIGAAALPARRATAVSPTQALRSG